MTEMWKTIIEYPNFAVSNLGNVKNTIKNKLLSSKSNIHAYESVSLGRATKGNNTRRYIHRLVAIYFVENPNKLTVVNHKDGNKRNNSPNNLEWCTQHQNNKHSWDLGLSKPIPHKINKNWVHKIRSLYASKEFSQQDLAFLFGLCQQTVCEIVNHKIWKEVV